MYAIMTGSTIILHKGDKSHIKHLLPAFFNYKTMKMLGGYRLVKFVTVKPSELKVSKRDEEKVVKMTHWEFDF